MQLDHVQIAIPDGGEQKARYFFGELLGLPEIPKPPQLSKNGCWFKIGDRQLHLGGEPDFRPSRKAHIALAVDDLSALRDRLSAANFEIHDDVSVDGRCRFFGYDPFGNRIEFIEPVVCA